LNQAGDFNIGLITDDKEIESLRIPAGKEVLVAPFPERVQVCARNLDMKGLLSRPVVFKLGEPIANALAESIMYKKRVDVNAILNRTPKFKDRCDIKIHHISDITQPFMIVLLGHKYPVERLEEASVYVTSTAFVESYRKKTLSVPKSVKVSKENWNTLPGGKAQNTPKIFPFCTRWVNNKTVSDKDYYLAFKTFENVQEAEQSLYWFADETLDVVYILTAIGIRYHADLLDVCLFDHEKHPHPIDRIPAAMLGFGWTYGQDPIMEYPKDWNTYYLMPELNRPFSIGREEEGGVVIRAKSGKTIAANTLKGAGAGVEILYR
jgi:hypothetical protein